MRFDERIAALLPHKRPMIMLDEVVEIGATSAHCALTVDETVTFADPEGNLPSWVGLELMAQTAGVWMGYQAKLENRPRDVGFLVGARDYVAHAPLFRRGSRLDVKAWQVTRFDRMGVFEGTVTCGGELLASGTLSAYIPSKDELERFAGDAPGREALTTAATGAPAGTVEP
jgi:predicted hotdog family 3-hydroxylacyl-ACP dehydratase